MNHNIFPFYFFSLQAPLSNVQRMKFRKGGAPFVLDFLPKVRLGSPFWVKNAAIDIVVRASYHITILQS